MSSNRYMVLMPIMLRIENVACKIDCSCTEAHKNIKKHYSQLHFNNA